jgi:ribosome biogenesis GTPase
MPVGSSEQRRKNEKAASLEGNKLEISNEQYPHSHDPKPVKTMVKTTRCLVVEASSSMCRVDFDGQKILCELRGNVKANQTGYVNPVAVGDWVEVTPNGSDRGVVESVLPRRSLLTRPFSPDKGKTLEDLRQIVVANVDRLLIVASWREPYIWSALIDRYLITAQRSDIEPVICINKLDLANDMREVDEIKQVYKELGYRLILTSAVSFKGIDELRCLLQEGTTVLAGLSGVGKSTLLISVQPDLDLKTGKVSEKGLYTGQGRHTTTQSSLWKLDNGGIVIDTPGVRTFGIAGIQPASLAHWYPEMVSHLAGCRFRDCTHISEPGCAVKTAVDLGEVTELRYKNYTQLFEELASI